MRGRKGFLASLALLVCITGPALAQPAPPGWPGPGQAPGPRPGPAFSQPYFHHHHVYRPHSAFAPPPGGWRRGNRFYGPPPVVIYDYGHYRLPPPPPGYYWTRSGSQFLMIAIASGIIASILVAPMH